MDESRHSADSAPSEFKRRETIVATVISHRRAEKRI
jgi:hypothetical protein